ncbi:MAG: hypothetical protein G01um101466_189 [Parcubacteria group bacterium Gr01-1014_66]|nr:MAG: hypothetical protein G01um101466_189 [Parcubacteria group bacterium Gr01-1014_66]
MEYAEEKRRWSVDFRLFFYVICIIALLLPFCAYANEVGINAVFFDPTGSDTGGEWVDIYNKSDTSTSLSGWQLYLDSAGYFTFPENFELGSKKEVVVHVRFSGNNSASDLYLPDASANMGNTAGSVALFSGSERGKDTLQHFVQWGRAGETWETAASDIGIWEKGTFVDLSSFTEGMQVRLRDKDMFSEGMGAWEIAMIPPQETSASSPTQEISGSSGVIPSSFSSSTLLFARPPPPSLRVDAGEDRRTVVGSEIIFNGNAWGMHDMPVSGARFWWNFGDGTSKEGKNVSHIFAIPGTYITGLHVSNESYTGTDYIKVEVDANSLGISEVKEGHEGFIRFMNQAGFNVDIGSWRIEDENRKIFYLPVHTQISARASLAFANNVTGLLENAKGKGKLIVRYPNDTRAFVHEYTLMLPEKTLATLQKNQNFAASSSLNTSSPIETHETRSPPSSLKNNEEGKEMKKENGSAKIVSLQKEETLPYAVSSPDTLAAQGYKIPTQGAWMLLAGGASVAAALMWFVLKRFL